MDKAMNRYVHELYFGGEGVFSARMAVYGTAHVLVLPLRDPATLQLSRKALAGYSKCAPDCQRDPCPWEAALLIAGALIRMGSAEPWPALSRTC